MSNRFTRVPAHPVPPLRVAGAVSAPLADAFMALMLSRPRSGSLRTTWVTPATLGLAAAVGLLAAAGGAILIAGGGAVRVALGIVLLVAAAGPVAVCVVGVDQHLR